MAPRVSSGAALAVVTLASGIDGLKVHQPPEGCACIPWTEVYQKYNMQCGAQNELFQLMGQAGIGAAWDDVVPSGYSAATAFRLEGQEVCNNFYKQLNQSICVNLGQNFEISTWRGSQWCYVDSRCDSLYGGGKVRFAKEEHPLAWKVCEQGEDERLRDKTPVEVIEWAKRLNVKLATAFRMAYPVWEESTWEQVRGVWGVTNQIEAAAKGVPLEEMSAINDVAIELMPEQQEELEKVRSSQRPVIFEGARKGKPPFAIVVGKQAFMVNHRVAGRSDGQRWTWHEMKCLVGCQDSDDDFDDA